MKKFLAAILLFSLIFFTACNSSKDSEKSKDETNKETNKSEEKTAENNGENNKEKEEDKAMELDQLKAPVSGDTVAIISTSKGDIKVKLLPKVAPKAVENFIKHSEEGYYNNLIFHRVIKGFMIQGGDPKGNGTGGESIWKKPFEDEFDVNTRNFRGALSMANSGPNTNGSQFFIVQGSSIEKDIIDQMRSYGDEKGYPEAVVDAYVKLGGAYWLDYKHTVFGQVYEGMNVVDDIASVKVDSNDKPEEDVFIKEIKIEKIK